MKRYRDNPILVILNILVEYVLLNISYISAGLIRAQVPMTVGKFFSINTVFEYMPLILLVTLVMVGVFTILGDYNTIHFKSKLFVAAKCLLVSFLFGVIGASCLFFLNGSTFSRTLIFELIIIWAVVLTIKRWIVDAIGTRLENKQESYHVILIGSGKAACRYYKGLTEKKTTTNKFDGYISEKQSDLLPDYLGNFDKVYDVIAGTELARVIISAEEVNLNQLKNILSICNMFGREALVIPTCQEYILENQRVKKEYGVHLLSVNALNTSDILGVNIAVTNMEKTIEKITENLNAWRGQYICVSNVHTTIMAHDDEKYRKIQNGSAMSLPDGGPLSAYSRNEGKVEAERVTGPDLMKEILIRSKEHHWRHFFYGSSQKTLDMLREKVETAYPGAEVVGMISPPYRELTQEEDEEYIGQINESRPDFVWVGLGAPKQEIWMAAHEKKVNALMIGVGAAFDYESGNLKRAPLWMQKCNMEWFYRFMQEPRRLFKRYFVTNIKYLWLTRR